MSDESQASSAISGASAAPWASAYSTAYSSIVGDDDNLANMIAYCLYKRQKREFIIRQQAPFDDPKVRTYHLDLNEDRIKTLRLAAGAQLQTYANTILESVRNNERDEIRKSVTVGTISTLITEKSLETGSGLAEVKTLVSQNTSRIISSVRKETAWWKAIIYSVIGGFALGLIIVGASRMGFMNPFEALPVKNAQPPKS